MVPSYNLHESFLSFNSQKSSNESNNHKTRNYEFPAHNLSESPSDLIGSLNLLFDCFFLFSFFIVFAESTTCMQSSSSENVHVAFYRSYHSSLSIVFHAFITFHHQHSVDVQLHLFFYLLLSLHGLKGEE